MEPGTFLSGNVNVLDSFGNRLLTVVNMSCSVIGSNSPLLSMANTGRTDALALGLSNNALAAVFKSTASNKASFWPVLSSPCN